MEISNPNSLDSWIISKIGHRPTALITTTFIITLTVYFIGYYLFKYLKHLQNHQKGFMIGLIESIIVIAKKTPGIKKKVQKEQDDLLDGAKRMYCKKLDFGEEERHFDEIPKSGERLESMVELLNNYRRKKGIDPKLSGVFYVDDDEEHQKVCNKAYSLYSLTNPLHYDHFPGICKFEREIQRMTINLFKGNVGGRECVGMVTSGGTESILLALKGYRDYNKKVKPWIKTPEIVVPETVHAAFDKGCHLFCIKIIKIKVDRKTFKVDPKEIEKKITKNTILIVGSACNYPNGMIDDIPKLGKIAKKKGIGLHVDSCLGGFYLPFAKLLGYDVPEFDFSVDGVTSISADTHKYAQAPKGSSVLMFADKNIRNCCFYIQPFWVGGHYATTTLLGSRSGGLIAGAWAALVHKGMNGYFESTKKIHDTVELIKKGVNKIKGVKVAGDPKAVVVGFLSDDKRINIYQVLDEMRKKGWLMDGTQNPKGFHYCITAKTSVEDGKRFINDMRISVDNVKKNPKIHLDHSVHFYGLSLIASDGMVEDMGENVMAFFLDGEDKGK